MRTPALPSPRHIAVGAGLALLAAGLTPLAASANPGGTGLVISEVYGGGGNSGATLKNDFIELYNPTAQAISVEGWSVQGRSATNTAAATTPANVTPLTGSVPAGGHYLVQEAAGTAGTTDLPAPDATGTMAIAGAGWQIWLSNGTTPLDPPDGNVLASPSPAIIDFVGGATTATSFETARVTVASSATQSITRNATNADTDDNAADFALATPTPTSSGDEAPGGPSVDSVGNKSFVVDQAITPFTVTATGGATPYEWSATGLPAGLAIDPATGEISGTPTATGSSPVTVTATDADDATGSATFTIAVTPAAGAVTPIAEVQGTGATTPLDGQTVTTQGVVTAAYPTGGLNGFYIQTPGADTANASDAIFVYGGTSGFTTYPSVGDSVKVTGQATEFSGATQIVSTDSGVTSVADLGDVTAKTDVPGTDCALPGTTCLTGAALDDAREVVEGELFQPTAPWTATDVYDGGPYYNDGSNSTAFRGELGVVANSSKPLVAPTEVIDAQATAQVAERKRYNDAHRIILDDGSSWTYSTTQNSDKPFPWFTQDHNVRVGSSITFPKPVVFTYGFNAWRILPQSQVVGDPTGTINFSQTRPAAPENVGGDLKLATFNVLNFFPTTGQEFVALGGGRTCTFFNDRAGNPISNNQCNPNGPRGAANDANLVRQRDKIVAAINTADADIVSLEELENSVQFGKDRDFAINKLVDALNADAGAGTWAAVPSPAASELPPLSEQDVIRNGFIYQPANVALVGESDVLADLSTGTEAFADAREPVAQAFKKVGTADADAFAVIVNHFKSKGSGTADPNGQGNANDRRVLQANALVTFANEFKTARGISRVFLAGDFNAYSEEDPIQVLKAAGYTNLESSSKPEEETYNFDGMVGSLDHVLANAAALEDVNAVDIWDINGYESVYYEYARFNTNVTNLYAPNPFRSSDHSPEIVGINAQPAALEPVDVQILGTNDFHGRLLANGAEAGAAQFAGAVAQLESQNPNTIFTAAGDLIGASTFESFIQRDKPTLDALNAAGLDVSSAGNHEFDAGYEDLVERVMAPYDATTNPEGGANWQYIAANVRKKSDNAYALPDVTAHTPDAHDESDGGTWTTTIDGVKVGFIGGVTEELSSLVSPAGIADVKVSSIIDETNAAADKLKADGADIVILLVHEGAPDTTLASASSNNNAFGRIVNGVDSDVSAIISGHTHLAYNHLINGRPVVSSGQYGTNLNKLVFTVDPTTDEVTLKSNEIVAAATLPLTAQAAIDKKAQVKTIVDAAVTKADVLGAVELGKVAGPFNRAKLANGTTENRGGESTLGNLVAEVQRWATSTPEAGGAQIAFMNPGGLRQDMVGNPGGYPATLTYKQAAVVQPFANTLVNMQLTGAQIKTALEQQWQRDGSGNVPTRPFLRLGTSKGFTYTYDPSRPEGDRVLKMWLNGTPIAAATSYSVTVNSFLGSGGDNFRVFSEGTQKRDTGKVDLQAMVDYMDEFANTSEGDAPLAADRTQHSVGVSLPDGSEFQVGDTVKIDLSSLAFSTAADLKDTQVEAFVAGASVGTFPVDNTIGTAVFDEYGTAAVRFTLPSSVGLGAQTVRIVGAQTGTEVTVPITVAKEASSVAATVAPAELRANTDTGTISVTVTGASPTGLVGAVLDGQVIGGAELVNGAATMTIGPFATAGTKAITVRYYGDDRNTASSTNVSVTVTPAPVVEKATPTVTASADPSVLKVKKDDSTVSVTVTRPGGTATGSVLAVVDGVVVGAGDLVAGSTSIHVGPFDTTGSKVVTLRYLGDDATKAGNGSVTLTVQKATPRVKVKAPKKVGKGEKATIVVTVGAAGTDPTGTVTVTVGGKKVTEKVRDGKATLEVRLTKTGQNKVSINYSGDALTESAEDTVKIKVKRR